MSKTRKFLSSTLYVIAYMGFVLEVWSERITSAILPKWFLGWMNRSMNRAMAVLWTVLLPFTICQLLALFIQISASMLEARFFRRWAVPFGRTGVAFPGGFPSR